MISELFRSLPKFKYVGGICTLTPEIKQAGQRGLSIYGGAPPCLSAELTGYTATLL